MNFYLKASLWMGSLLALFIAGFYWWENRRGAEVWEETRSKLESEGETLKFSDLIPAMPPDEENFVAIPLVASIVDIENRKSGALVYRDMEQYERIAAMVLPSRLPTPERRHPKRADHRNGDLPDFEWWAELFREEPDFEVFDPEEPAPLQILSALGKFDSEFLELGAATDRPHSVLAVEWPEEGKVFEFAAMSNSYLIDANELSKVLKLRGMAALAAGQPEVARESIHIMFRFAEAVENQPKLIANLTGMTIRARSLPVIWYGLRERFWREQDLLWLEDELDFRNCFDRAANAFRGEMVVYQIFFNDAVKDMGYREAGISVLFPDGCWDLAKSEGCRFLHDGIIRPLVARDYPALVGLGTFPFPKKTVYNDMVRLSLPAIDMHGRNLVRIKILGQLAKSACALERYFLKTGVYPETAWSSLVPEFLASAPEDPLDGKPIRYKPTGDGRYRVYSIGSNLVDGGGHVVFESNRSRPDYKYGDWVWGYSYPEREPSGDENGSRKIVLPGR